MFWSEGPTRFLGQNRTPIDIKPVRKRADLKREIASVKVVEILGGRVVSGLGRDFGEGGGLVVAEAVHCLQRHVAML